jgi:hypothetical protein
MTRDQLLKAKPGIVALIREQAEKRLENQCGFADAQDGKGGALLTASASLAAASAAVAAAGLALERDVLPLLVGTGLATIGFSLAGGLAVWALRSEGFHAVGWYPQDFEDDLARKASAETVEADFVIALQSRLSENNQILERRGDRLNWSSYLLFGSPLAAAIAALMVA